MKIRRYLIHIQAIYPPLVAAFGMFGLSYVVLRYILHPRYLGWGDFVMYFGTVWTILFILDSLQRFRHYLSAVSYLKHHSADVEKLLRHEEISWCTRESAKAACRQHSEKLYQQAICFYVSRGIYYYHLFPKNMFSKNSPLFQARWWYVAFFDMRTKDYLADLDIKK